MGFLERVRSSVGQGAARVASEADRTIKLTRLANELGAKRHDLDKSFQELGQVAYRLIGEGKLKDEALDEVRQRLEDIQAQVKTLEQEMADIRVGDRTPEVKVTSVERPCPSCGKAVPEGMKFCGFCGHSMP